MTTLTETRPRTSVPSPPAPTVRPARRDLFALLSLTLERFAMVGSARAAWQGPLGAPEAWRAATGAADLDIWCDERAYTHLDALLSDLGAARVQHADNLSRLRHTSYAVETTDGLAVVDLTRGDLMVGPVLMVPAGQVRTTMQTGTWSAPRLTGAAGAADLFVRPLLRGRLVTGARLAEARAEWSRATSRERGRLLARLEFQLGRTLADAIERVLDGAVPRAAMVRRARAALMLATLRPSQWTATWEQRRAILPARSRAGILGLRTHGCLVVLVGTDGSGKSTVASSVERRLHECGVPTTSVYMGMARGNLPGVSLARRLLGVAPAGDSALETATDARGDSTPDGRSQSSVRRLAAWYYAAEYAYRWWRDIRPGMRRGGVVISDRYVYDLRESPWPGSRASRVAEWLLPKPQVLVLPDAPDALIHARKPERSAIEQAAQQARFRTLLARSSHTTMALRVDTSGLPEADPDPVAAVVSAVVAALHGSR